ncbi:hypothetical protein DL96DRAFT_1681248 [Flagelloscypha sp. PMI_526]|nr:hypothetical protein DL96DRAFT_1681248 [Flagelloscypha sp. PMI_526]
MAKNSFLQDQRATPRPVLRADLSGKTILLVGGNTGLGFEACVHFASMKPAKLIITARNQVKAEDAVKRVRERTSFEAIPAAVDLSSYDSVRAFCDHITSTFSAGIDILVLNAAVAPLQYETTSAGWEIQVHVNYISPAWIILRLLPIVKERVVMLTSEVQAWAKLEDDILNDEEGLLKALSRKEYYNKTYAEAGIVGRAMFPYILYDKSKLLDLLFIRAIIPHLPSSNPVILTTINPGFCMSDLRREIGWSNLLSWANNWYMERTMARTTEEGSRQIVFAALSGKNELGEKWRETLQGGYVTYSRVDEPSGFVETPKSKDVEEKLLHETISLLKTLDPKLSRSLQSLDL